MVGDVPRDAPGPREVDDRPGPGLVFASSRPPFPLTYGAGIRSHRLLTGLAAAFDVTLVTQQSTQDNVVLDGVELARRLPGVRVVAVPASDLSKRQAQARSLLSARSHLWGRSLRPGYGAALRAAVAETSARIVHFEDPGAARFGPVPSTLGVFAPHNVEHRIVRGSAETEGGLRGAFSALEWRKIRHEEQRAWRAMDLCLAVSEVDAATFREGGARRVELCPNGADALQRLSLSRRRADDPLNILFVGTASYQPYERGVAWFVSEVMPRVQERVPAAFRVVGSPPLRPIPAAGVEYVGSVASVQPFYEMADVVVVPVFHGSGTRLKVLEAMAYGRPVVATPLGAEGLPVRAPEHFDAASDASSFAGALVALAAATAHPDEAFERRLEAAHEAIRPLFWPTIVAQLVERYRLELEQLSTTVRA